MRDNGEKHWLRWIVTSGALVVISILGYYASGVRADLDSHREKTESKLWSHELRLHDAERTLVEVQAMRARQEENRAVLNAIAKKLKVKVGDVEGGGD